MFGYNIQHLLTSLDFSDPRGTLDPNYWMEFPATGHLIATRYNLVLHFFSRESLTFLPVKASTESSSPEREVAMALIRNNHMVHLTLETGCPVPPINVSWKKHHESSVDGWDRPYADRVKDFQKLVPWN